MLGQRPDSLHTRRIGAIGSLDVAYNFQDKVLGPGMGRKWTAGVSYCNKKREFIVFVAAGIKGFKINALSSTFRGSFINDVQKHYVPINHTSEDSLVGAKMNGSPGNSMWGTYSQYVQAGFILVKYKWKPTISFYLGREDFLLYGGFAQYEDPENHDIDYVSMTTTFYELKLGCTIPFKKMWNLPCNPIINIGYKWVDYGKIQFASAPLSAYTTGDLADKYRNQGKLTVSLSFYVWSNWDWRYKRSK
ncbi:MAG: hypothetical protein JWP12_938 [Bacteroidetes bacterium]|nr:hypothetical protein [Bacteroidota bacterium]